MSFLPRGYFIRRIRLTTRQRRRFPEVKVFNSGIKLMSAMFVTRKFSQLILAPYFTYILSVVLIKVIWDSLL